MMHEITLRLDKKANESLTNLMGHYNVSSKAGIISKALSVLQTIAHIDKTEGELVARKGEKETRLIIK